MSIKGKNPQKSKTIENKKQFRSHSFSDKKFYKSFDVYVNDADAVQRNFPFTIILTLFNHCTKTFFFISKIFVKRILSLTKYIQQTRIFFADVGD